MATFNLKIPKTFFAVKEILIDDEDYERIKPIGWSITCTSGGNAIQGNVPGIGTLSLANFILKVGRGVLIDHKNRDYSDNRKENLRICTIQQNSFNRGPQVNSTTGYKGIHYFKRTGKWTACLSLDGKHKHLGYFTTPEAAARAYDVAARKYFGEFAYLNFPDKENEQ